MGKNRKKSLNEHAEWTIVMLMERGVSETEARRRVWQSIRDKEAQKQPKGLPARAPKMEPPQREVWERANALQSGLGGKGKSIPRRVAVKIVRKEIKAEQRREVGRQRDLAKAMENLKAAALKKGAP